MQNQNANRVGSIYFHNRTNQNSTNYKPLRPQQSEEQQQSNMTCTTYKSNLNGSQNSRLLNGSTQNRYTLNSLWCIWYGLIVILFQVYIIIRNVQRFTSYLELPWPVKHEPFFQLNAYVVLTAIGVVIMPFFFVSTVVRIGNYSNDGIKLGSNKAKRKEYEDSGDFENASDLGSQCSVKSILASWWKHSLPMMGLLHFASAACFLSAHCLMEAELIKHGFLNKETIWKTELDFALNKIESASFTQSFIHNLHFVLNNQTMNDQQLILLKQTEATNMLIQRPLILPEAEVERKLHLNLGQLSSEYINFVASLLIIAIRYPTVYWHINKLFGLIFSFQLILNAAINLIAYSAFSMYFKLRVFGVERALLRYQTHLSLGLGPSILLFIFYTITMQASASAIYYYGLNKYEEFVQRKRFQIEHHQSKNINNILHHNQVQYNPRSVSHSAHFFAFLVLLLSALTAIPLMYDFFIIYFSTMQTKMLISSLLIGLHCLQWLLLWILFTCKQNWSFQINNDLQNLLNATQRKNNDIYGTTKHMKTVSSQSMITPGMSQHSNYGLLATVTNPQLKSCLKVAPTQHQIGRSMINLQLPKNNASNSTIYGQCHPSTSIQQRQQLLRASLSRPTLFDQSHNGTATPVRSLYRDAYSDSEGLGGSINTKKSKKLSKLGKFSFREKSSSSKSGQVNSSTLPNPGKKQRKLRLRKKAEIINDSTYDSECDYTDYASFKQIVRRENTDDNLTTHLNLCPLQNDRGYLSDYDVLCMRNRAAAQAANVQQQIAVQQQQQQQQQQNAQLGPLGNMNSIYGTRPQMQANNFINEQTYISAHDTAQLAAQKQQQQQQQQQQLLNQAKAINMVNNMNMMNAMNNMNNMNNVNTLPTMNSINNLQQQQQQQLKNQQQMLSNSVIYQGLQSIKEHFGTSVSDSDTSSGIHSATTGSIISTTTPPNVNTQNNLNNSAYNTSLISSSLNSTNQMMQLGNLSHNDSLNHNNGQKSDSVENLINCIQAPKPFLKSLSMTRQAGHQFQQLQQQRQQSQPSFNLLAPLPPPPRSSTNQPQQMHPQMAQMHNNIVDMRNMLPFEPPTLNAAELIAINGAESIYGTKTAPNVNQQTPLLTNNSSINAGINSLYGRLGNQMSSFSSLPHGKQQQQKQLNSMPNCNTISNSGSNLARQNQMLPLPPQHLLN